MLDTTRTDIAPTLSQSPTVPAGPMAPDTDPADLAPAVDRLARAVAVRVADRVNGIFQNGSDDPEDAAVIAALQDYLDLRCRFAARKSQGALSAKEFARAAHQAAAAAFGQPEPKRSMQMLDNRVFALAGDIVAGSSAKAVWLPDHLAGGLFSTTRAMLRTQVPVHPGDDDFGDGGFGGEPCGDGPLTPEIGVVAAPVFLAVEHLLVQCLTEADKIFGADEFTINVQPFVDGAALPVKIYNRGGAVAFSRGTTDPKRFEYFAIELPLRTGTFSVVCQPYELNELTAAERDAFAMALARLLDEIGKFAMSEAGKAIQRAVFGANPAAGIAVSVIANLLTTPEVQSRIANFVSALITGFINRLPGAQNEIYTAYVLTGAYQNDPLTGASTAIMGVSGGINNSIGRGATPGRPVRAANVLDSTGERVGLISGVGVEVLPEDGRGGRYTLSPRIVLRGSLAMPMARAT